MQYLKIKKIQILYYYFFNMGRIYQLLTVVNRAIKDKGIFFVIKKGSSVWIYFIYHKLFSKQKKFIFRNKLYNYFYDIINNTWTNERSVKCLL